MPSPSSSQGVTAGPAEGRKNRVAAVNSRMAFHRLEKWMSRRRTSTHPSTARAMRISER